MLLGNHELHLCAQLPVIGERAPRADGIGSGALHAQDAVPGWHHPHRARALDLMARLAALVPKPRMHLTRYHGVLAPHSQYRAAVTPAHRGRGAPQPPVSGADPAKPSPPRHVAMSWARWLKRVFGVQIERCARCGGAAPERAAVWGAGAAGAVQPAVNCTMNPARGRVGSLRAAQFARQGARPLSLGSA